MSNLKYELMGYAEELESGLIAASLREAIAKLDRLSADVDEAKVVIETLVDALQLTEFAINEAIANDGVIDSAGLMPHVKHALDSARAFIS